VESPRTLIQQRIQVEEPLVLERYRLLEKLGAGGFGTVWSAHDELLHRDVALKRIWLGPDGDSERAKREAQAGARLDHPAIVRLYEVDSADDAFYLISELVEGQTLAQLIADEQLADEEVLEIGLALAEALAHAHAQGVIHRDIKPQNVLIPDDLAHGASAAKLTDFGGASLADEDVLTRTGDVLGTLAYMAPEQAEGRAVGQEADLYSLALVLYEALSGVNPVRGATPAATARRIGSRLDSLARRRSDLPRALTHALDTALAPDPADRGTLDRLRLVIAEALERGLELPRWPRRREPPPERTPITATRRLPVRASARRAVAEPVAPRELDDVRIRTSEQAAPEAYREPPAGRFSLPRAAWSALALAAIVWQAVAGRPGVSLLVAVATLPLLAFPPEPRSTRVGASWIACALAPLLGLVAIAGAFPALAGQLSRWRERLAIGALGYWWLTLAEPLLGRRLWLGVASGTPARTAWESSITSTASHVVSPLLSLGVLFGALLWALAALVLPWVVRGRHAPLDILAVVVWSAALVAATPELDAGLSTQLVHPSPHGAILGAIVGAIAALAARALRGPV
jgi:eukaryotic-like serine/threonine-protein kinase